jgi:hypothetical protein
MPPSTTQIQDTQKGKNKIMKIKRRKQILKSRQQKRSGGHSRATHI